MDEAVGGVELGSADEVAVEAEVVEPSAYMRAHPEGAYETPFGEVEEEEALVRLGREARGLDDADADLGDAVARQVATAEAERGVGKAERRHLAPVLGVMTEDAERIVDHVEPYLAIGIAVDVVACGAGNK
jgi:hypothetical protein